MIPRLIQTLKEDVSVITHWIKGDTLSDEGDEDLQRERVQIAAWRMIGFLGMSFGSLWALSIVVEIVTFPLMIGLKLATAVTLFVLGHDIFTMSQNASQHDFSGQERSSLIGLLTKQDVFEQEIAEELTRDTFLQSLWMKACQG